jgi:cobyrinic acid a,c-diamide synthase
MARSAAALVLGFSTFDREVSFAGVLFNRIGSETHLCYLKQAMAQIEGMGCLGGIPRDDAISMPERHLGLVTGEESPLSGAQIDRLADLIERNVDLTALMDKATSAVPKIPAAPLSPWQEGGDVKTRGRGRARIGVARDESFCFYYQDNLDWLAHFGAEIVSFSPLRDPQLPERLDGVYLGGGYPELFAERLAENVHMRRSLLNLAKLDIPIYAECGGLMYLSRKIEDMAGRIYPMVGALPLQVRMGARLRSLGYREITFKTDTILGPTGTRVRGHEFHYSDIVDAPTDLARAFGASGRNGEAQRLEGYSIWNVLASYVHLHFGSNPDVARFFLENCAAQRRSP